MARPQIAEGGDCLQIWRVAANILNKQSRTADKGSFSSLGVGLGANNSPYKISLLRKITKDLGLGQIFWIIRPLRKPRRRWVDNIKMYLREIGWGSMDWVDLAQDRHQWGGGGVLVNAEMNLRIPESIGQELSGWTTGGFSRRARLHGVS
jgi:hypothetical protein